ncbi:hypothetical protein QKT49_gp318 [Acanthamoeba castellanii medusavirus]|uniref:Uncharacterized protein n=1 Tax=Acanthamoeba castellanii medusavirus J1 TaxID=3114988 RepID=A0A3T1CXC6_9VIRU|nr:hypothetical protein QKT49_gp318 [Acanthamoeba castellanii medusavirus]BBI30445.1 hypothetical protein [Acanthamoeba castellanii medusavirus J1]
MQNDETALPMPVFPTRFVSKKQIAQPHENIKLKHREAKKQRRPTRSHHLLFDQPSLFVVPQ